MQLFLCFALISLPTLALTRVSKEYKDHIIFRVFSSNGVEFNDTFENNQTLLENCNPTENFTIIVHGWTESINCNWAPSLIQEFLTARRGCVFFMDYFYYSNLRYFTLVRHFDGIYKVLLQKLLQLDDLGFDFTKSHLFGFSYGTHVAFEAAYQFSQISQKKVHRLDACDPAGPSFTNVDPSVQHAAMSATHVQCIHTSDDKGTKLRFCQKSVNMGQCGRNQIGATERPLRSHGLCPIFYRNSITMDFPLVSMSTVEKTYDVKCKNLMKVPDIETYPATQMGFRMNMTLPDGEYYALTGKLPPFNTM
ncbi:phospholipase A1-like [Culicoides brevitarsis]|uniref:phospholipase A1-like n=1 Tax=Culicoides brevitarsis TaxID=469753 RepID=UPI00307CA9EA